MQIYKVAYKSDNHRVYGYLGLPSGCIDDDISGQLHAIPSVIATEQTTYATQTSNTQAARLSKQRLPLLIYCRGGIGRVGQVRLDWIVEFLRCNYVVFAPCYRGSEGGDGRDEFGGADVEDVVSAVRWLCELTFVDVTRITLLGFSRGSINATRASLQITSCQRLILWGGVSDLAATYGERPELQRMLRRVVGGTPTQVPLAYAARSPWRYAYRLRCPVILVHGDGDVQVDISHARRMEASLQTSSIPYARHIYANVGHHLPLQLHRAVVQRMLDPIHDGDA